MFRSATIRIRETVGERGPVLLQDVRFIEKMAHFDRERIPERVVHAGGRSLTVASRFTGAWKRTQTRNSTMMRRRPLYLYVFLAVTGGRGSADTVRDPRGFAVKFYTEEGNYDLVGNNSPGLLHQGRWSSSRIWSMHPGGAPGVAICHQPLPHITASGILYP